MTTVRTHEETIDLISDTDTSVRGNMSTAVTYIAMMQLMSDSATATSYTPVIKQKVNRCVDCNKILYHPARVKCKDKYACYHRSHIKLITEKESISKINKRKGKKERSNRGKKR